MTVLAVLVMSLALAMLAAGLVLFVALQRRLASLESSVAVLADRPVGLSVEDAEKVAELTAQRTVVAVRRASLLPALGVEPDHQPLNLSLRICK